MRVIAATVLSSDREIWTAHHVGIASCRIAAIVGGVVTSCWREENPPSRNCSATESAENAIVLRTCGGEYTPGSTPCRKLLKTVHCPRGSQAVDRPASSTATLCPLSSRANHTSSSILGGGGDGDAGNRLPLDAVATVDDHRPDEELMSVK